MQVAPDIEMARPARQDKWSDARRVVNSGDSMGDESIEEQIKRGCILVIAGADVDKLLRQMSCSETKDRDTLAFTGSNVHVCSDPSNSGVTGDNIRLD